jgi:hypothetical protein
LDSFYSEHVVRTRVVQQIDPFDAILNMSFAYIRSCALLEAEKYCFQVTTAKMGLKGSCGLATVTWVTSVTNPTNRQNEAYALNL